MKSIKENSYRHVKFLTSIHPYRNFKNLNSLRQAADYIERELGGLDVSITRQPWVARENTYENIIASYRPEKKLRFIVGAHYDVYKDQPGADDNASGVAGLLEMARVFSQNEIRPDFGIDWVFFCLEEPPFFKTKDMGSYIHAQSIADDGRQYLGMIALEMIGYYRDKQNTDEDTKRHNRLIVSGIKKFDDFNQSLSRLITARGKIESRRLSFADDYKNGGPSDHRNYWPLGIPAAMVIGTAGHGNPNYHRITDTIDTLDFDAMTDAIQSLIHAVSHFQG